MRSIHIFIRSNQDMSIALLKEIATYIHRFNRRSIETSASLAIVAFTSLKAKNQGLQLQLKKKALQLERSVNWNSTVSLVNQNIYTSTQHKYSHQTCFISPADSDPPLKRPGKGSLTN